MRIEAGTVVSLTYKVSDQDGNVVDEGFQPMAYVHGGRDPQAGLFPAIQKALDGKRAGDSVSVELAPLDAFGDYDEDLVFAEPREAFPKEIEVGTLLTLESDEGKTQIFRVVEFRDDLVVVDGNHPLAGMPLVFAATVDKVRAATDEEMASSLPEETQEEG
jgi:FKBP-type peptidyl-prolyl cis-trans isomerase SlyD